MNHPVSEQSWERPSGRAFTGRFVSLTPLNAEMDYAELFQASHQTDRHQALWQYLWQGPFADAAAMRRWLRAAEQGTDPIFFTVNHLADTRKIGMISIMSIAPEMGRAELGHIWYAPEVQRTKVNTESVFLLMNYLLSDLHYRRIEWKCDARNDRSRKAAVRLGFIFEGIFRQHMIVKGQNRDTAWFSLLDLEWPRVYANVKRWLYEEDGISLTSLNLRGKE